MAVFQVHLYEADRNFFEGECESLTIPVSDGLMQILAHHSNMIAAVVPGVLRFRAPGQEEKVAAVSSGMVKVENNDVLVLVDSMEWPEEIDAARARRQADEARELLLQKRSRQEYRAVQVALARAINRLRLKSASEKMDTFS